MAVKTIHIDGYDVRIGDGLLATAGEELRTLYSPRGAAARGLCSPETVTAITATLTRYALPVTCPFAPDALLAAALGDKKRRGGTLTLVLPQQIGQCVLHRIPVAELGDFLRAAISA